jgi:hypothetical protein
MGRKTKEAEERHNQREKERGRELRKVKKEKEEKEKQRKAKKAESQRQLRARKKQEQQSLSESSDGRPPLPVGETMSSNKIPSTPMNEREPLPVQTPSPYPHHNNAILARATTSLQQTPISWQSHIPPGMANATPEQLNEFMSMQTLMMAQQTTNEIVAKVYSRREAAAPRRNLNATMNEARAPPPSPPLIEDSRASITPEPFPSDNWHVETPDQFASLWVQWYQTLSTMDSGERIMLCLRFLAHAIVEHEEYFVSIFSNHPDVIPCATDILEEFAKRKWIQKKTVEDLRLFIKNHYIPAFKEGLLVEYRQLDDQGNVNLVKATIVKVHDGILGAYTIRSNDGRTRETTVERMQPEGGISDG